MTNEQIIKSIKGNENNSDNLLRLYNNNLGLINKIIDKHNSVKSEKEDMLQDAYIVLCEAVEKYDLQGCAKFSTFFANYLNWFYFRSRISDLRIPAYMNNRMTRLYHLQKEFKDNNQVLSDRTIMYRLGITKDELDTLKSAMRRVCCVSLYSNVGNDEEVILLDIIPDEHNQYTTIEESIAQEQIKEELWRIVDSFQDSELLHKHFEEKMTFSEIADDLETPESRIYDRYKKALRNLKQNSGKLKTLACDSGIYSKGLQGGVSSFRRTHTSSTEKTALKLLEIASP